MSFAISHRDIQSAHQALQRYASRDEKAKEKEEHVVGTLVRTAEVAGTSGLLGILAGRFADKTVPGTTMPVATAAALGLALGGHLAGFLGFGGQKNREHLHAVADGGAAFAAAIFGTSLGVTLAQKAQNQAKTAGFGSYGYRGNLPAPQNGPAGRRAMTPMELYALAEARGRAAQQGQFNLRQQYTGG